MMRTLTALLLVACLLPLPVLAQAPARPLSGSCSSSIPQRPFASR